MKYKKKLLFLSARQKAWDSAGANYQRGHKKPGSEKSH